MAMLPSLGLVELNVPSANVPPVRANSSPVAPLSPPWYTISLAKLPCEKSTVSVSSPARVSTMIWLPVTEEKGTVTVWVPDPVAPAMPVDRAVLGSEMTNRPLAVSDSNVSVSSVSPPSVSVMTRFWNPSSEMVVALSMIRGSRATTASGTRDGRGPALGSVENSHRLNRS